jgi:antitoxin (DNA-binding transcriptional repressor) of toxin-antitoxin stability system
MSSAHAHELPEQGELAEVADQVATGGVVYLTRGGHPVAKVVPLQRGEELKGQDLMDARRAALLREFPQPTLEDLQRFARSLWPTDDQARAAATQTAAWRADLLARLCRRRIMPM